MMLHCLIKVYISPLWDFAAPVKPVIHILYIWGLAKAQEEGGNGIPRCIGMWWDWMRILVHTWLMWGTLSISAVLNCSRFVENGPAPGYHVQLSCLPGGGNLMWGWCWPPNSCRRPTTSTMWTGACANWITLGWKLAETYCFGGPQKGVLV